MTAASAANTAVADTAVSRASRTLVSLLAALVQAGLCVAALGVVIWQIDILKTTPTVALLTMTFVLVGVLLALAALVCLTIAFLTTRRQRVWRIAAAALDTLVSIPILWALLEGFVGYGDRRLTDFVPDPGNWPLLVLGSATVIWILTWAIVAIAGVRTPDMTRALQT